MQQALFTADNDMESKQHCCTKTPVFTCIILLSFIFSFLFCALLLFLYTLNHSLYVVDLYSVTSLFIK